jgi:hypothetical protein
VVLDLTVSGRGSVELDGVPASNVSSVHMTNEVGEARAELSVDLFGGDVAVGGDL